MPTTTGDNIFYRNTSTPAALESESATQAQSVQVALDNRKVKSFKWANAAARTAQTGMTEGDIGDQADTDQTYRYDGTSWKNTAAIAVAAPSTVSNSGGGSYVQNGDGSVTFTAVGSISLNGTFDGTGMDEYDIIINLENNTGTTVFCRLRSSGVDTAGSVYSYILNSTTLATGPTRVSSTTGSGLGFLRSSGSGTTATCRGRYTLTNPRIASGTAILFGGSNSIYNGDRYKVDEMAAVANPVGGHDGITVLAAAGTMSGTIRILKIG